MQINNYAHSSNSSSFGMALKITPAAKSALEKATMKQIEQLQKAGEALKDTKYYHLEIGEGLTPRIDSPYANSYLPPFSPVKPTALDPYLSIKTTWDGTTINGRTKGQEVHPAIKFDTAEQAESAYNKIKNMYSDIERATEITKLMDKAEIKKIESRDAETANKAKIQAAVKDLLAKFGAESHVKD